MPLYGTLDGIKQLVRSAPAMAFSVDEEARLTSLQKVASLYIENTTAAVFTVTPAAEQREIYGQGDSLLRLCAGIRSITGVLESPDTYDGTVWSGGTAISAAAYRLQGRVDQRFTGSTQDYLYYDLRRVAGQWLGRYAITGVWQDQYPAVPDDITYWAQRLASELYKQEKASPHGTLGTGDGTQIAIRNALKIPELLAIQEKYTGWKVAS